MWTKVFGIGDLDGAAFAKLVLKLGTETGRFKNPVIDLEKLRIVDGGDMMNLENVHATFLTLPRRARDKFIREGVLARPAEVPETWAEVKEMLVPVVRHGAYLAYAPLQLAPAQASSFKGIARKPLASGVFETLVIDTPHQMMMVSEDRLDTWGVTLEDALDVAHANLRRSSQDAFVSVAPGVWAAPWTDSYAAARVTLPELLQRVCTDPLVAIPNRDTLLVAERDAFEVLVLALDTAIQGQRYAITTQIYQLDNKTLRVFEPPADTAREVLDMYRSLRVSEQADNYGREKEMVEERGSEVFFASLMAYEKADGGVFTTVVWTNGVDGFLPPAETIQFLEMPETEGEEMRVWEVPWDTVAREPGMLTQTDSPLPRWQTGPFPTKAWLAEHGKVAERPEA